MSESTASGVGGVYLGIGQSHLAAAQSHVDVLERDGDALEDLEVGRRELAILGTTVVGAAAVSQSTLTGAALARCGGGWLVTWAGHHFSLAGCDGEEAPVRAVIPVRYRRLPTLPLVVVSTSRDRKAHTA